MAALGHLSEDNKPKATERRIREAVREGEGGAPGSFFPSESPQLLSTLPSLWAFVALGALQE